MPLSPVPCRGRGLAHANHMAVPVLHVGKPARRQTGPRLESYQVQLLENHNTAHADLMTTEHLTRLSLMGRGEISLWMQQLYQITCKT